MSSEATLPRRIQVLPPDLADKIAAGEVIERPGSVVKELVENSLDARARIIRVDLEDGGKKKIAVLDNGAGIADDDVAIALERHATSKIEALDDLWNLRTMGFRGEALPSIAAISRFTIQTRSRQAGHRGRRLYLEGGKLLRDEWLDGLDPIGSALGPNAGLGQDLSSGTIMVAEDLFYNVPARLKFLRSKSGENAFVRELLERIALCNPRVGFLLYVDGRKTLDLKPVSDDCARVAEVFDTKTDDIEEFGSHFENIGVRGWLDRNNRANNSRYLYLAVNGRMVRDKLLQQAVLVALRPTMMEGEYPKAYISVEVDPGDVDVNVHPAKSEVRFRRSRDVFQVVHGALEKIARRPSKPFYLAGLAEAPETVTETATDTAPSRTFSPPSLQTPLFNESRIQYRTKENAETFFSTPAAEPRPEHCEPIAPAPIAPQATTLEPESRPAVNLSPGFAQLQYIGQVKNTYLLFQDSDGLVVVDQHAAHERVNYERIKARFFAEGLRPQPLLVSMPVKCKADEVALALEHAAAFERLGFELEVFGESSLLLRAIPEGIDAARAADLFHSLLDELKDAEQGELLAKDPSRLSPKLERILSTAACHGSVRAGQSLSPHEARELMTQMDLTPSSLNCPHGRPASIKLGFDQIEGLFKRV